MTSGGVEPLHPFHGVEAHDCSAPWCQPTLSAACKLIDERKSPRRVGMGALREDASSLLRSVIVTQLALLSLARLDMPEPSAAPPALFHEAQSFTQRIDFPNLAESTRSADHRSAG